MDSQRLILFFVFAFSVFMLLDGWQRDQQPAKPPPSVVDKDKAAKGAPASAADVPVPSEKLAAPPAAAPQPQRTDRPEAGATIEIETDLLVARISSAGGDLRYVRFKQHRDTLDKKKDFVLLEVSPERTYIAQSGLIGNGLPNHRTAYTATAGTHTLADGQDTLDVRLTAPAAGGANVVKTYRFRRNSYLIEVSFEITNKGSSALQPYAYFQLVRDGNPPAGDSAMLPTFTGVAVYTEKEKFQKL